MTNHVQLSGTLTARDVLRYTPAGIAMLGARLSHQSEAIEAGHPRRIEFEVALRFVGAVATRAENLPLGEPVRVDGFLAPVRRQSKSLVVHVTEFVTDGVPVAGGKQAEG
mgnify:CR=1 FL=1